MSRKNRSTRSGRTKRSQRTATSRSRRPSGSGWHMFMFGDELGPEMRGVKVYVNPHVSAEVARLAMADLLARHFLETQHGRTQEFLPDMHVSAHRYRGAGWVVVTDFEISCVYIATPDVFFDRFGWTFSLPHN